MEPVPSALEAQNLNHWIARVPWKCTLCWMYHFMLIAWVNQVHCSDHRYRSCIELYMPLWEKATGEEILNWLSLNQTHFSGIDYNYGFNHQSCISYLVLHNKSSHVNGLKSHHSFAHRRDLSSTFWIPSPPSLRCPLCHQILLPKYLLNLSASLLFLLLLSEPLGI